MFLQKAYAGTVIQLPKASTVAARIDSVADLVFIVSVFFFIAVVSVLLYFAWKYHRSKKGRLTGSIVDNHKLETVWTVIPLIFMLGIFAWGFKVYFDLREERKDALEINVIGRQWMWNYEYTNGRKSMNDLYVPIRRPVRLLMTSEDVLHSYFVPNFRLKQDVIPGQYTYIAFEATLLGKHPVYCAEFCGTSHSDMLGNVYVLEPKDFDTWFETGRLPANLAKLSAPIAQTAPKSLADKGREVFNSKGCFACHSVDGSKKVGPSLKGIFGTEEEMASGVKVKADENYLRESLMEPQAKIVKGFAPSMPTFKGLLNDEEVNALIAYVKSLK